MRLDKLLSHSGYGSRKEVRKTIKSGAVRINADIVKNVDLQVKPEQDHVEVNGNRVQYKMHHYYMMNKPQGVITATEDVHQQTVLDLMLADDLLVPLFPVGRLDKDTQGLLLLTNDGQLAHRLLSPKKKVPKTYEARIAGRVVEDDIRAFRDGMLIDEDWRTLPAKLELIQTIHSEQEMESSEVRVTITEGKFHQIKRMFAHRGKSVTYLKRISMGDLQLDSGLAPGNYRQLHAQEIEQLGKA